MMLTRRRFLYATAAAALGAAAAPAAWVLVSPSRDDGPPEIAFGRDRCDACGMIISDARFAAASREDGLTRRYDDIGCLIARGARGLVEGRATAFVHDARTRAWIEPAGATFVRSPRIPTPMGYGLAAYANRRTASASYPEATVLTFDALLTIDLGERS